MNERFTYLVVKFLEHDLEGDEISEFEQYLSDPECREYLRKAKIANRIIEEGFKWMLSDAEKNAILRSGEEEIPEEIIADVKNYKGGNEERYREVLDKADREMRVKRKFTRIFAYGSAAAAMVIGVFFILSRPEPATPRELYNTHMKPYYFDVFRSQQDVKTIMNNAKAAYSSGYYTESMKLCKEILTQESRNQELLFLYGLNLMEMDSVESALQQFETVKALQLEYQSLRRYPVHWYSALAHLRKENLDAALSELEIVMEDDPGSAKADLAEELYKKIERLKKNRERSKR